VWKHLLPALDAKSSTKVDLGTRKIAPPQGSKTSSQPGGTYKLEANDLGLSRATFTFSADACTFTADSHTITCGLGKWQRGETAFPSTPPRLISGGKPKTQIASQLAASAAWTDERTLTMAWRYYETPHSDTVTCQFDGDAVTITFLNSITGMNAKAKDVRAPLRGQAVK
jgi:hypothetical protein